MSAAADAARTIRVLTRSGALRFPGPVPFVRGLVAARVDADPGATFAREASMAKLKVTETAKRAALEGMQMMGGYGYATEYDMERHVRSALVTTIFGGTSEIQRDIIGKTYGL